MVLDARGIGAAQPVCFAPWWTATRRLLHVSP
jgi:hypothetical protein